MFAAIVPTLARPLSRRGKTALKRPALQLLQPRLVPMVERDEDRKPFALGYARLGESVLRVQDTSHGLGATFEQCHLGDDQSDLG